MAEQNKPAPELDYELRVWFDATDDDTREVIVEAKVPQRRVRFASGSLQKMIPVEVTTDEGPSRASILQVVQEFLTGVVGSTPHVNHAAGAIPLRVNRDQLRQIISNPLIKAVRTNRRLK